MPFYYDFNKTHDNAYLRLVRRIYRPLGFQKGYNFPLWVIMGGALLGFGLYHLNYYDYNGHFRNQKYAGGGWEYYQSGHYRIGMIIHLATVIPACLFAPWQFLPVIRHKLMIFHRLNGYLNIILLLMGNISALTFVRHTMGGDPAMQTFIALLFAYTTTSLLLAYYNIKRLQIDQHRAWMLRAWLVAGSIITLRIVQKIYFLVLTDYGDYYFPYACHSIDFLYQHFAGQPLASRLYPACASGDPNAWAAVKVDFNAPGINVPEISATVSSSFASSGILALFLHAVFVELYIALTPAERDRLKLVSYERQLARGWKRPGNSGLTVEMWGDARPWRPDEGGAAAPSSSRLDLQDSDLSDMPMKEDSGPGVV